MPVLYIVLGFFIAGAILLTCLYHRKEIKMTSTTTGQVISATQREIRTTDLRRDETIIVCSYSVAGHTYQLQHTLPGRKASRFPPGAPLTIRYNPTVPKMARIALD